MDDRERDLEEDAGRKTSLPQALRRTDKQEAVNVNWRDKENPNWPNANNDPGPANAFNNQGNTNAARGGGPNHRHRGVSGWRHRNPLCPRGNDQREQGPRLERPEDRPRGNRLRQHNDVSRRCEDLNRNIGVRDRGYENRQQDRNERCLAFRSLEEMARSEDQEIIVKINERKTQFMNLLESNIDPTEKGDIHVLIMEILSKVSQSAFDELKLRLLLEICNSRYILNLRNYLTELPYATNKHRNTLYWNNQESFWTNYVQFCLCIIEISPSTALHKHRSLIEAISKCCLEGLRIRHGFEAAEVYIGKLNDLRERLTLCEKEEKEKEEKQNRGEEVDDPPDDFRLLNVLPTREDLLEEQPFLRANVTTGGYKDIQHYLDVQFRLLREDCFGPLRDGISQFLKDPNKKKYDNIRVYHNVKFVEPYISKNKIGKMVMLDEKSMKRLKRINWAHSKRFIYGSLLLLTKDNCRSFITATILERDIKLLNRGKIPISIMDKTAGEVNMHNDDSSFIMIESEVYFEPYFHVLKALQDADFPEHLAMEKYIVKVDAQPNNPAYMTPDTVYKVETAEYEETEFNALDVTKWPSKEELGFNASQYEACKLALTHEFSVIQGPPGTGKTYLGVKVAKTLLENLTDANEKCLMLVICYTNHALDQFLEAILSVTDSIVRIGGQSRNEAMEKINLSTLRKKRKVDYHTNHLFYEQKRQLIYAVNELKNAQERLDSINTGVISAKSLVKSVPEVQILCQYYAQNRHDVKSDPLCHWLFEHMRVNNEDINNFLRAENVEDQNDKNDLNDDNERIQVVLDEFDDIPKNNVSNWYRADFTFSFTLKDMKETIKSLTMRLQKTQNPQKQMELYQEIIDAKSRENHFIEMMENTQHTTRLKLINGMDLGNISMANRWAIYLRWAGAISRRLLNRMRPFHAKLDSAITAYEEARTIVDINILKGTKVIGMTTSGAARQRKLLKSLAPKIMIVEEAAEVLEQHIVTSLTKHCQHLILIGDHQQLRPSAAYMRLARDYNLEVSLFERMIRNGVHSRRLAVQHRMRPEIAALISPHIYPDLQNHPSVEQFPNVRGMTHNLFFFTHNYKEEAVEDTASKSNQLEADMTLKLAQYLMQQGYEPGDVTILAAYSGQMFYMRKQRDKYLFLSKVKITVVDNYQGEESKIIILSLVRNNDENKIGFLGTENRICVALSRAREGFYIFGNIDILKGNSELWAKISKTLEEKDCLGPSLMLKCETHADQITMISSPKDFETVPEGGCSLTCGYELPCGHRCKLVCHGYDRGHVNTKCYEPCTRIAQKCDLEHVCPLPCWEECKPCEKRVQKTLPCGHQKLVFCHLDAADPSIKCETVVTVTLPHCGHEANKQCHFNIEAVRCPAPCVTRVDKCGHQCRLTCHVKDDPDHEKYCCEKPCELAKKGCTAKLEGDRGNHQCTRKCYEECEPCTVEVIKKLSTCTHKQSVPCNVDIKEIKCLKKCARAIPECGHHCKKKCHEPCGDCMQMVRKKIPECNHEITVQCRITPTRSLCKEKCNRKLQCGHKCMQRCNQVCDTKKCTEIVPTKLMAPCGHAAVMLPCNVYQHKKDPLGDWDGDILLEYCTEPCGQELSCKHVCGGSCGACRQGRLHVACTETCNRTNICGHLCKVPCNQVCPPCDRVCEIKCTHSKCNKACGAPCTPCKENCVRACVHGACKRRCGQACSRPPCEEACPERLRCGHRCRGLCGEPCPDICKQCRPDDFPTDLLGDEYDDDAKFVKLEDCSHVLDVENMDNLIKSGTGPIGIRKCPFCRAPIINTPRYKDLINHMLSKEINPIKKKVYGDAKIIKGKQEELLLKITRFSEQQKITLHSNVYINKALIELNRKSKFKVSLPKLETRLQYFEILDMITECYKKYKAANITALETELNKLIQIICSTLSSNIDKISLQLQKDIGNEIKRVNSIIQLAKILGHTSYLTNQAVPEVKQAAEAAKKAVFCWHRFEQDYAVIALKTLEKAVKVSGIVTKEERDLIVRAIGSKVGSWYKCPNGHFYTIGDCGMANEESQCADCKAPIGGRNYMLASNNVRASVTEFANK